MHSLDRFAQAKLDDLQRRHLRRTLSPTYREDGLWVERGGRRLLSFSCNDYLNMSQHPATKRAAMAALERYGAGSGASRLVTGNHPLYAELESRLARMKETEDALVFGSGYLANAGIIPVLIGRDGLVLIDELAHACLYAGAQLSRGRRASPFAITTSRMRANSWPRTAPSTTTPCSSPMAFFPWTATWRRSPSSRNWQMSSTRG